MDKHETLLARSERVIGKSLELDANKIDSKPKRSLSQRREQVLQAQRTHRHRTQEYIRELEKEVFRLRDENESMLRRFQRMQSQLLLLKDTLIKNGIPADVELDVELVAPTASPVCRVSEQNDTLQPSVQVNLTAIANVIPERSCENHPAEIAPLAYQTSRHNLEETETLPSTKPTTQVAIDFILALEQPCLAHIKHTHLGYSSGTTPTGIDYNSGPGHLLTASANIIHQYHRLVPAENIISLPESELERLLQASARLQLDNEMTPVEIWAQTQAKLSSSSLADAKLQKLTAECLKYVFCNSFGAVVERSTVVAILADVFDSRDTTL